MKKSKAAILAASSGAVKWTDVTAPDAAFSYVPFTVQQTGRRFRAPTTFNLRTHANITVAKTYYVDKSTGNDGNAGTAWATALKTLTAAYAKADVDRIYVRNGYYLRSEMPVAPWSRNVEIIGDGTATLTSDVYANAGAFAAVDNHYNATFGSSAYVAAVFDRTNLDSLGYPSRLTAAVSEAACNTTPGSFYYNYTAPNSTMSIRLIDGRAPDANVTYLDSIAMNVTADNRTVYFENLTIYGGFWSRNSSATGGAKFYAENCRFLISSGTGITVAGVGDFILNGCTVYANGDGINYDARNGIVTKAIEINCNIRNVSSGSSDQASTTHNACVVTRIMGSYHDVSGQCVADTGVSQAWMLGSLAYTSRVAGIGYYLDGSGGKAWLDCCSTTGGIANYDLQNGAGSTTYTRNFTGSKGANSIAGTLSTY